VAEGEASDGLSVFLERQTATRNAGEQALWRPNMGR
jgi:hypothetical protein